MEAARCMLYGIERPLFLWGEAVAYATYMNRVPSNESQTTPSLKQDKTRCVSHQEIWIEFFCSHSKESNFIESL